MFVIWKSKVLSSMHKSYKQYAQAKLHFESRVQNPYDTAHVTQTGVMCVTTQLVNMYRSGINNSTFPPRTYINDSLVKASFQVLDEVVLAKWLQQTGIIHSHRCVEHGHRPTASC